MRVVFRVDASTKMGSGHVMRCLTLAEELEKNGSDVSFISRVHEGNLNYLISKKGFQIHELQNPISNKLNKKSIKGDNYNRWLGATEDKDAQETIKAIGIDKPDWLIVDHYALSEKWEKTVRPTVKNIMVIDDLANRSHDCDMLLDQNWFENMETRYEGLVPAGCTKLLGPEYALLRPEFFEARKSIKKRNGKVDRIFVFFGGSDPQNLTGKTLHTLINPELAHLTVDVVIGSNNPHQDEILKMVKASDNINLYFQINNIAAIMAKADFAIGSGGVNIWERMCLKIHTFVIVFADNQKETINHLHRNDYLFDISYAKEIDEKDMLDFINNKLNLKKKFLHVDGLGVNRLMSYFK